jgi:hypothetical protein
MVFVDRSLVGAEPSIFSMSMNFSELGFTLNDEVMLIMRGVPMVNKFWRGIDLAGNLPPDVVDDAADIQEFDQLMAMYPMEVSLGAVPIRNFADISCGIIFGTVDNFRETVTVQSEDGEETQEIDIDLRFDITGDLFFGNTITDPLPVVGEDQDFFVRSELINPDHEYMFVVPAGEITIITTVTDLAGDPHPLFEPDEETIFIGPGGVREIKLKINQQTTDPGDTTGGGGGGGGAN